MLLLLLQLTRVGVPPLSGSPWGRGWVGGGGTGSRHTTWACPIAPGMEQTKPRMQQGVQVVRDGPGLVEVNVVGGGP